MSAQIRVFNSIPHEFFNNSISNLQATTHYFVYYINTLLKRRSQRFKRRTRCLSFMALNKSTDVSVAIIDCHGKHT